MDEQEVRNVDDYGRAVTNNVRINSNLTDSIKLKYEMDNYLPFNEFDRYGIVNTGQEVKWKRGMFYNALLRLDILCLTRTVYMPCLRAKQDRGRGLTEEEAIEMNKYFKMLGNGKWGFVYRNFPEFIRENFTRISEAITEIESEEEEDRLYKEFKRDMSRRFKAERGKTPNEIELNSYIMRKTLENRPAELTMA